MQKLYAVILTVITAIFLTSCGGFFQLKSSISKQVGPKKIRVPYSSTVNYYGYIAPSVKPDGRYRGKKAYYLYFWVPAVIDEVGVSMYSPATKGPGGKDAKHPLFDKLYAKDSSKFFDTYIALERLLVIDAKKIKDAKRARAYKLASRDDSSEIPANPSGRKYNSLLRHKSQVRNPTKALVRSVYRIIFTSFRGNVQGSYVATVGTNIPGVKIAASLEELHKMVNKK